MQHLIYYPGFEVTNPDWLKFALLYIDNLTPIIPSTADPYLTDLHWKLTNETDLIDPYVPHAAETQRATLDAVHVAEDILNHPHLYSGIFGCEDIVRAWRNPRNHRYTLFGEKYVDTWEDFCQEHRLGTRSDEGVLMDKSLGFTYMTVLAQAIADAKGVSPITDRSELDKLSIFARRPDGKTKRHLAIAQSVIGLALPSDLSQIGLDTVIGHRRKPGFKKRLHAFHSELTAYVQALERGEATKDFFESRGSVWREFSDEIVALGAGVGVLGLGIWLHLASPDPEIAKYFKEVVGVGALLSIGAITSFRNKWKHTQARRYTRKYLADLRSLRTQDGRGA